MDLPSGAFHCAALLLIDRFERVIAAFDVNVRLGEREKAICRFLRENANAVDAFQSSQDGGPILFVVDRPARAFELADRLVRVEPHEQQVAQVAGALEISHVAEVQDVKAAVGDHEFFAARADIGAPGGKIRPRDQFLAKIHRLDIGGTVSGLAIPE